MNICQDMCDAMLFAFTWEKLFICNSACNSAYHCYRPKFHCGYFGGWSLFQQHFSLELRSCVQFSKIQNSVAMTSLAENLSCCRDFQTSILSTSSFPFLLALLNLCKNGCWWQQAVSALRHNLTASLKVSAIHQFSSLFHVYVGISEFSIRGHGCVELLSDVQQYFKFPHLRQIRHALRH